LSEQRTITLKAIEELFSEQFFIPSYQRGYRWEKLQVTTLLDDLEEFEKKEKKKGEIYCLQPVVVKKRADKWEVIDGQQRLTTIFILLKCIDKTITSGASIYSLSYESRPNSQTFLENIGQELSDANIDYHYMSKAYEAIAEWLDATGNRGRTASKIYPILLERVKIIWYELEEGDTPDPIDVFTRLNLGKIPLTDAELIKALLLKSENFKIDESSTKSEKRIQLRQLMIASQWDQIEYSLQEKGFWYFLTNEDPKEGPKISFILDLVADNTRKADLYTTFRYFNTALEKNETSPLNERVDRIWESIYDCFQRLQEWYYDRELYHLIGFLLAIPPQRATRRTEFSIASLLEKSRSYKKTEFTAYLKDCIKSIVECEIADLTYDDREQVRTVLLLFNIQSLLLNKNSNIRFQFDRYKIEYWDLEHIHAVRSRLPENVPQQREWIEVLLNEAADTLPDDLKNKAVNFLELEVNIAKLQFEQLANEILVLFDEDVTQETLNGIGNLTLLDMSTNRSYKNAIFPAKREKILRQDENGSFIPICTKNVFLKYYTPMPDQLTLWSKNDMEAYRTKIISTLSEYGVS
jgi:hypothetical protein